MKQHFKSVEHAKQHRDNVASWQKLLAKYDVDHTLKLKATDYRPKLDIPEGRSCRHIPSLGSMLGQPTIARQNNYTGDAMLGIATMHKSNSVPVFNKDNAVELAKMRRG